MIESIQDSKELVKTSNYPNYARFPFENFNPVQSSVFNIFDKDCNAVIAAATSSGKTVCAEMFMANEVRVRGGKSVYLAPLKALAKEKIDDWTDKDHHFSDLNLSICTGDYLLTEARRKEIEKSNIIVMTSEMLNSRCRNQTSEKNDWLKDIGTIVVDESHLLTVPNRGDHLEVGLMKLSEIAKNVRFVFLSATMPNVDQISQWLSKSLNKKKTYLLESKYRPCPLGIHYEKYNKKFSYEDNELSKINAAVRIIKENSEDKFLAFVHTKRTGEMLKSVLKRMNISCEFHNADLNKDDRHNLENKFKSRKLDVLIATSTIAWGCNLPARRVIITGVHRGLYLVDTYDIWQMAGRAGRPGYDPRGDVYILLPDNEFDEQVERIEKSQLIESRLLDYIGDEDNKHYKCLAFHLVAEIFFGKADTKEKLIEWYDKSLGKFQAKDLEDSIVESTLKLLIKCGAIIEKDGRYEVTSVGKISSMFYYSPFDVADLKTNFTNLFKSGFENNDLILSMCFGNVDTIRMGIVNNQEKEDMNNYKMKIKEIFKNVNLYDTAIKGGFAYYCMLTGMNPGSVGVAMRNLKIDLHRTLTVLNAIDFMSCRWDKGDYIKDLRIRMEYSVPVHLVHLCKIPEIGKVRAEKLYNAGIKDADSFLEKKEKAMSVLGMKPERFNKVLEGVKEQILVKG